MWLVLLASCCEPPCDIPRKEVVEFETRDGVALVGDLYSAGQGRPGVLLLHQHPQDWDRTQWPCEFIREMVQRDWTVLAIDRRGAGESEGEIEDAYTGEGGRYDVDVSMRLLVEAGAGSLAIVGASNGTTSMVDYAVWAPGEGQPEPVLLVFLSGGTYTENQTDMEQVAALGTPALFVYPASEAAWNEEQMATNPGSWVFREYPGDAHGVALFESAPESAEGILGAVEAAFGR